MQYRIHKVIAMQGCVNLQKVPHTFVKTTTVATVGGTLLNLKISSVLQSSCIAAAVRCILLTKLVH